MKLLQINTVINSGSTGRIAEEIGLKVMEQGGESFIAFGRKGERPSQSHKMQIGTDWDVKWHGIATRLFDRHGFVSAKATKKLIEDIKLIQPDIIHLHNLHGYYLNIELLFNYLSRVNTPVVWTLHDCWAFTGHCTHFSYVDCNKWKVQCEKCPQKKEYPASFWMDNSFKNYQLKKALFTSVKNMTIVPVSNWLADIVKQSFFNKYPIETIYNGIDTSVFKPSISSELGKKYGLENKFIILGVAGVWSERKGLHDFIELSDHLTDNEKIVLVGLTPKQIKLLPPTILGVERTESVGDLAELYSLAEVFINPTWEDNFPTTNLEALSCGTPVITYKTGGSPESLTANTGFVVEQGDLNSVRRAINEIKKNGKNYYTNFCRDKAVNDFNKNKRYNEYIQLYKSLLNQTKTYK